MKLSDFDYNLPKGLIAQYPAKSRDSSRLLVLDRATGNIEHRLFTDITGYLCEGDLLLLNNTKVVPSRLIGKRETGGRVEALIMYTSGATDADGEFEVLLKPARASRPGTKFIFGDGSIRAEVTRIENGRRFLRFDSGKGIDEILDVFGRMPLPPYIKRGPERMDRERYQTIYASKKGAIAAPTAGLHFTKGILSSISKKRVDIEYLTLHVGYGTFKPVRSEDIGNHRIEKEYFEINNRVIQKVKGGSCRRIAVGTTTCRAMESIFNAGIQYRDSRLKTYSGWTDLFIRPPYRFKAVDSLLTNFHLPRTTLLMLVAAFCGKDLLFKAYGEAIKERYRFYSYGDAMLII